MSSKCTVGAIAPEVMDRHAPRGIELAGEPMPSFTEASPALAFQVLGRWKRARASLMRLPHGCVRTPVYMPVGTQGTVKGLTSQQLAAAPMECEIILGNTYHLGSFPGPEVMDRLGGLHRFMNWPRNLLTDSGGFQMVSLLDLAEITEEGVTFQSPVDGRRMLLTPEMSMGIQNKIGADIMMALDDVVHSLTPDRARFEEATHRTIRWLDRCIRAHRRPREQNLFGITQGGLDVSPGGLRDQCLDQMLERDAQLPGYAIGGLAGGEDKHSFWRVVSHATRRLPEDKPRYLMGVGMPVDLVVCTALGVDMYDCVHATRTARFGCAMVPEGTLNLRRAQFRDDLTPVGIGCPHSRAYIHALLKSGDGLAGQLLSVQNIAYLLDLMRSMRAAILAGTFPDFVRSFMRLQFPDHVYPQWARDALLDAGIELSVGEVVPRSVGGEGDEVEGVEGGDAGGAGAGPGGASESDHPRKRVAR